MALDPRYSKAIQFIMHNQNGEAAQQMNKAGIQYNMNYGVSLLMLRELAQSLGLASELAKQLWSENMRETKLLGIMTWDPEEMTPEEADKLVSELTTGELVENACHHLLWKLPFASTKVAEWIASDNVFVKMTGLFLGARLAKLNKELTDDYFGSLFEIIEPETSKNIIYIKKSISLLLIAIVLVTVVA